MIITVFSSANVRMEMEMYEAVAEALDRLEVKLLERGIANKDKVIAWGKLTDLNVPGIFGSVFQAKINSLTNIIVRQLYNCEATTRVRG